MKVLLLADVHSNWTALEAVVKDSSAETFDAVLSAGDLVDYGCRPAPCLEWAQKNVTAGVRGNHDHAVAQRIPAAGGSGFKALAAATRPLHWTALSPRMLKHLGRLPVTRYLRGETDTFFLVHGTPRDPLDEYLGPAAEEWSARLTDIEPGVVVCGHTHHPMDLALDRHRVINPGSVGQPRDGRPGAAYAVLDGEEIDFRVAEYAVGDAVDEVLQSDAPAWVAELTEAVLKCGGTLTRAEMAAFVPPPPA